MHRKLKVFLLFIFLFTLPSFGTGHASPNPPATSLNASQVISAINNYRQENGVAAFTVNSTLSVLAQGQSNFQASTGNITHTGSGGTTPTDRAYAAGYGDGNKFFLSEIIYGGYKATVDDAITWWKGSSLHNRIMLDPNYMEIGAGVTTDGDWTYFTAEIAWITIYPAPSETDTSSSSGESESSQDEPFPAPVFITKATPMEDGSIIHVIQEGQTLWAIAAVYDIDLDTLLSQNELTRNSFVFPGDEITVLPPNSLSTNPLPTEKKNELEKTPGEEKPQAIGSAVSFSANDNPTETIIITPTPEVIFYPEEEIDNPSVQWVIILAFGVIFFVIVGSLFFQKQPERPSDEDVVR